MGIVTGCTGGGTVGDSHEVGGCGASDEKSSFGMSGFGCSVMECGDGSLGEAGCDASPSKLSRINKDVLIIGIKYLHSVGVKWRGRRGRCGRV